jgi:CRP-like cAMP-binding protein
MLREPGDDPTQTSKGGWVMSGNEILRVLSNSEVFNGLTNDELELFSPHCQKVSFQESDTLLKEGQTGTALYIIIKGQLKAVLPQQIEGRREQRVSEVRLNLLKEGDCFGEYSLIAKMPVSASIVATKSGELIKIPENDFNTILMNSDHVAKTIYYNILQTLIKRLRRREEEYDLILIVG